MKDYGRFVLPVIVGVVTIGYLIVASSPPEDPPGVMKLHEFGKLPIIDKGNGRVKPFESAARTKLMLVSGRQVYYDEQKTEHSAVEWMLDALTSSRPFSNAGAYEHKVFRIENDQVLSLLGLEPRPGSYRYSLAEIGKKWTDFIDAVGRVEDKKEEQRDLVDTKLSELADHVKVHMGLADLETPMLLNPGDPTHPRALGDVLSEWRSQAAAAKEQGKAQPALPPFLLMLAAYDQNQPKEFNDALDAYHQQLATTMPAETQRAAFEVGFDDFDPFYQCTLLYFGVFTLICLSWGCYGLGQPNWARSLQWSAFVLAGITFVVHTGALIARMYLMNRWGVFVTNLYGTAIFIGWVSGALGMILEVFNRNSIGIFVTAVAGFATMIIAQFLAMGEDTMEMMRAVLDTNFWLATHVTSVNVGYAATMAAGELATLFVLRGLLTPTLNKEAVKSMGNALYGVLCFATLFSFTGTVLGGIWADQSWGRFWGWDPKENGAMLIVLWNALILHARWGGLVKARGMAVLALFGNIIVIWSWWGVNMLGVGLHAYANADPGMLATVLTAVGVHLALIAAGLLPTRLWWSFRADAMAPPPPRPAQPNGRSMGRGSPHVSPEPVRG